MKKYVVEFIDHGYFASKQSYGDLTFTKNLQDAKLYDSEIEAKSLKSHYNHLKMIVNTVELKISKL